MSMRFLVFLVCACLAVPVAAQLEEVIVTAQKRAQNLLDVPMAVTAVGREFLENNEINTIEDLTKVVPSLRLTPDGSPSGGSIRIRGVGTQVFSTAVEPNVLVMVDEVPLARNNLANFDFADIERIEVLRGPQGTLFGKNASAGLIHVVTRDPAPEFEARVRLSAEQPDNWPGRLLKVQATASGPLTDSLGLRLTAFDKRTEGHLEDVRQDEEIPDVDRYGVRGKLRWDPTNRFALKLNIETQRTEGEASGVVFRSGSPEHEQSSNLEFGDDNRQTKTFGNNRFDSDGKAASLALDWDLGFGLLTSITSYRDAEEFSLISRPDLAGDRVDLTRSFSDIGIETITQEFRISSNDSDRLEYTAGILWFDNRVTKEGANEVKDLPLSLAVPGLPSLPAGDALEFVSTERSTVDTQNLGVFAEGSWHISNAWHLTVGARYIDEQVEVSDLRNTERTSHSASGVEVASNEFSSPGANVSDTDVTGRVSLQYFWREHSQVYATVATGYRGRAFDLTASQGQEALDNPLDPEKATSFELGYKSRLFDERVELSVTAFHTVFRDFQAQITDLTAVTPSFRLDNAGELETQGVEVEFLAQLIAPLTVSGSLLYNPTQYNEFVTQCFQGQRADEEGAIDRDGDGTCDAQDVAGRTLANAPERSASLTARYEHIFAGSGQTLYGQITGRWQDEVQFSNDQHPNTIEDAYSVWDIRAGWSGGDGRLQLAGYIKNVFAQRYASRLVPLSLTNDRRDITHFLPAEADRQFGVSVEYQW